MSSRDYGICRTVAEVDDNIAAVGIIEEMEIAGLFYKPNVPIPKGEKISQMVVQYEMLVSIAKSNDDFFGSLRYLLASFETYDSLFFSLPRGANNKVRTLVIRISRPYDITKLLDKLYIA